MLANRMLLLSGALASLLVGCGKDDRANAAPSAAPVSAAAPKPAAKRATTSGTVVKTAAKPTTKPAAKATTKPATKPSTAVLALKIPQSQLPPPGQCRIWKEGTTASQQPHARSCAGITPTAPAGSMVLYRTAKEPKIVRVGYIDAKHAGMVVRVRVFDAGTGKYLRDEKV
jgi:hypothetical protein